MHNVLRPDLKYRAPFEIHKGNYLMRTINKQEELEHIYSLTYECYIQQGYCSKNSSRKLIHYPKLDNISSTTVFVIENSKGGLIGTASTTKDSQHGLHVDLDFHAETEMVRSERKILSSSWRIAVNPNYKSQPQVARLLIDGTVAYWHAAGIETCLMTFNPCHENFYKKYLNCKTLSKNDGLHDLKNAPAVLMRWDASRCPLKARLSNFITNNTAH